MDSVVISRSTKLKVELIGDSKVGDVQKRNRYHQLLFKSAQYVDLTFNCLVSFFFFFFLVGSIRASFIWGAMGLVCAKRFRWCGQITHLSLRPEVEICM